MVNADVQRSASGVTGALDDRDVVGVGAIALLTSGGFFLAQEIADQVLPMIDFPQNPSSPTDLAVSALVKVVAAFLLGAVALRMGKSSTGGAALGVVSIGVLASMGMDLFDAAQRGGIPGSQIASGSSSPTRVKSSSSPSPSPNRSPRPARASASGGVSRSGGFRGT